MGVPHLKASRTTARQIDVRIFHSGDQVTTCLELNSADTFHIVSFAKKKLIKIIQFCI